MMIEVVLVVEMRGEGGGEVWGEYKRSVCDLGGRCDFYLRILISLA